MQTPVEIVFDDLDPSPAVDARIRRRIGRLERLYGGITSCHVAVRQPHRHQRKGRLFTVRIETRVPGQTLVVSEKPGDIHAHDDAVVAVRDAFDAMERELETWLAKVSGAVKTSEGPPQGRIAELDPAQDCGHVAMSDGRLVYFHENSVVDPDFAELAVGDTVEVVVRYGESPLGPQASTVRRIPAQRFVPER